MNHDQHQYKITDFIPLLIIFMLIIAFTIIRQFISGWDVMNAMNDFMAGFFIVFGVFKLMNLNGFVEAYKIYDLIAQKSTTYAYAYPFIEVGLGIAYLLRFAPFATNLFTFILMSISALGVGLALFKGERLMCACLGTVFKLPMTYVTLFEDLVMAIMALYMLLKG